MKNLYPNYKGKRVEDIRERLKLRDNKTLNDFLDYCRITAGEKKIKNIERIMLQIYDVLDCSLSFNLERLRKLLSLLNQSDKLTSTQNDIKKVLKRFLKWKYSDWNNRFAEFRDLIIKDGRNHDKINSSTILKEDEIESLLRQAESLRYKAMIILAYESAGRPEEILKLKWNDIDLDRGSVKLHSSKTGRTRINPIKEAVIHLKRYKQEYPYSFVRADDYVFPSPKDRKLPIASQKVHDYLKKLGFTAIKRPIFMYLIRHTRLTSLHQKLSPKAYEKFADHSIDTAIKHYSHLSSDDVREEMLEKIYHIEEISGDDKIKMKKLEEQIGKLSMDNSNIKRLLEKIAYINKTMLKAATENKKIEADFKTQFKEMSPEVKGVNLAC